jgi:hypothetical protein
MNDRSLFRRSTALLLLVAACSPQQPVSDSGAVDSASPSADVTAPPLDANSDAGMPPPPEDASAYDGGQTFRHEVSISLDLMPGEEVTRCTIIRLGNTSAQFVRRVYADLGDASHHLIFYKSSRRTEQTTPRDCQGFSGVRSIMDFDPPIVIAQQRETTLNFPPGVGFPIDSDEYVRMEFHAVNLRTTPIRATARVVVDTVDQRVPLTSANLMFWGNTRISLAPMSPGTVDFFHTPLPGVRVFGLTSHTHHFGVRSTIHRATGTRSTTTPVVWSNVTDGQLLHDNRNWSDPPLTLFDPPITFPVGEGLHLRCNYMNTSNRTVTFGESVDEEMCFLWAYYYPAPRGTHVCAIGFTPGNGVACFPPS